MTGTVVSQDNALITVTVDGISLGAFDTKTGGDTTATVNKSRSGDSPDRETTWRTRRMTSDLTVARKFEKERDITQAKGLRNKVGYASVSVTEQPRDDNDIPAGDATTWVGRLSSVGTGDSDINGADARMLTLTLVVESVS